MFLKPCLPPERLLIDLALKRRISSFHLKRGEIEEDYHRRMTGYRGEKIVSYFLKKLPFDKFDIIHDLRLPSTDGETFFQIDYLVLSAVTSPLIIEVKNWLGDLYFDHNLDQVIRTFPEKNKRERVQNPVLQAQEQANQLAKWLAQQQFGNVPIEYLFVNAYDKTIISTAPGNEKILQRVCTTEILINKINMVSHDVPSLKKSNLTKLEAALLGAHTPPVLDIQQMYGISQDETLTGVHCPKCFAIPMEYKKGIWYCSQCSHQSKTACNDSIYDYFLLNKPSITNSELRFFLHVESPTVANHILKSLNLPHTGTNKGRIYCKPEKNFPPDA